MTTKEKEIAEWYDNWHRKHGTMSWRQESAYRPFVKLLDAKPGDRLLDVGCGTGFFLKAAEDAGLETYGIDISAEAVALSKQTSPRSTVVVRSMQDLSQDEGYDYITALGSLEHCPDIEKALDAIRRALVYDGTFIAMVPNSEYDGPKMSVQDEIMETRYPMDEWCAIFVTNGFTVVHIDQDMMMWHPDRPIDKTYQFIFTLKRGDV